MPISRSASEDTLVSSRALGERAGRRTRKRRLPTIARILLGLLFFAFGLNGLLKVVVQPTPKPAAAAMLAALMATGYFWPFLKVVETTAGALLLSNRFVPLALALLAPILVNITAFYAGLDVRGIPMMVVLLSLEIYLAWCYRRVYAPMLSMRPAMTGDEDPATT